MKIVLLESTESLKKAEARFKSMHQQYKDNLDETQDEKLALRVALEDERVVTADLQHLIKSKEATIAHLRTRPLTGLERKTRSTRSGCFVSLGILRIPGEAERRRTHPAPSNACPADP